MLDIRPLLWKDGWPVAGENLKEGTYEIESVRTGTALELAVEGMPVGGRRGRGGRGGGGREAAWPGAGAAPGAATRRRWGRPRNVRRHGRADSAAGCRGGLEELARRQHRRPHGQLPVPGAAEVDDCRRRPTPAAIPARRTSRSPSPARTVRWPPPRTLSWSSCPPSPGGPEQLWRIDQLADGTWRIMPKSIPIPKSRSSFRPSAAVSRRWRSSIPRARSSAGCSRRHETRIEDYSASFWRWPRPPRPKLRRSR